MRIKLSHNIPSIIRLFLQIFSIILLITAECLFIITIISLINIIVKPEESSFNSESIFGTLLFLLLAWGVYFKSRKSALVEFDANFLYITHREKEEKIDLVDIVEIKKNLPGSTTGKKPFYTIKYKSLDGKTKYIEVNVILHLDAMEKFKINVHKAKSKIIDKAT